MATFTSKGLREMGKNFLGITSYVPKKLKLYVNDLDFNVNTVRSDLTALSSTRYSAPLINPDDWIGVESEGVVRFEHFTIVLQLNAYSGGITLYGYFVENVDTTDVMWIEKFDSPMVYPADGLRITINPVYRSENDDD